MQTATTILILAHQLFLAPEGEAAISEGPVPFDPADLSTVSVPQILCYQNHKPGKELQVVPAPEYKASLSSYTTGWKRATQPI